MDPIRHAAVSLAFLLVSIKDLFHRALDNRRAEDLARSPIPGRGESGAQDSERADPSSTQRPIDF